MIDGYPVPNPWRQSRNAIEYDEATRRNYRFEVDINQASWSELTLLPGIGEKLANRIVGYRELHGAFEELDDLKNVDGIGEKKLEAIRSFLRNDHADYSARIQPVDSHQKRIGV